MSTAREGWAGRTGAAHPLSQSPPAGETFAGTGPPPPSPFGDLWRNLAPSSTRPFGDRNRASRDSPLPYRGGRTTRVAPPGRSGGPHRRPALTPTLSQRERGRTALPRRRALRRARLQFPYRGDVCVPQGVGGFVDVERTPPFLAPPARPAGACPLSNLPQRGRGRSGTGYPADAPLQGRATLSRVAPTEGDPCRRRGFTQRSPAGERLGGWGRKKDKTRGPPAGGPLDFVVPSAVPPLLRGAARFSRSTT